MRPSAWVIKIRRVGEKRFAFLSAGGTNRLSVHATRWPTWEAARNAVDRSAPHDGYEIKVVELKGSKP